MGILTAIVMGGAGGLHDDLEAALDLFTPDLWIACNAAGYDHPGRLDHWATFHCELFPGWIDKRAGHGFAPAGQLWTAARRVQPTVVQALGLKTLPNWGGSSGMLAMQVALEAGAERVVLCGIPLEAKQAHYDDPARKHWSDAGNYRRAFITHRPDLVNVRSMSGWTREILGAPTREWFDEGGQGIGPGTTDRQARAQLA